VSYPEPFTQEPLSGRNEAVMTDSGISTGRATSEASQLTVRCSTVCSIMSVCFFDNIMIHCFFLSLDYQHENNIHALSILNAKKRSLKAGLR
jgi:hypothetical protein